MRKLISASGNIKWLKSIKWCDWRSAVKIGSFAAKYMFVNFM
jgi:hypothetical protein